MSRDDGFTVMDVSTDIVNDPKVRKLFRIAPDHANAAFVAFIATLGESWKAGRRVKVDEAWPGYLDYDEAAVEALITVGLLDRRGLLSLKAWEGWFGIAKGRRDASREKWRRENDRRRGDRGGTAESPRGDREVTEATVPLLSVRSSPSVPTGSAPTARAREEETNGSKNRTREKVLAKLSEDYQGGLIDERTYTQMRQDVLAR